MKRTVIKNKKSKLYVYNGSLVERGRVDYLFTYLLNLFLTIIFSG